MADFDWALIDAQATESDLARTLLERAAGEALVRDSNGVELREGTVGLAARRRFPLSTLMQFESEAQYMTRDDRLSDYLGAGCADGHVHQGASLPLEVVTHWIASATSKGIDRRERAEERPEWQSVDHKKFRPEPLLALLRLCLEDADLDIRRTAALAYEAATTPGDAWSELNKLCQGDDSIRLPTFEEIIKKKKALLADAPHRWLLCVRVESILHAALMQGKRGLADFVKLFEQLGGVRKSFGNADKANYFHRAIEHHAARTPELVGLELRFGELALTGRRRDGMRVMREDLKAALEGYRRYLDDGGRPLRVTFPTGLVKTNAAPTRHWRFNATDLFRIGEDLIDLLTTCPAANPFIDGVDVAGLEDAAPTWLFTPAYERLATWSSSKVPMAFRFHAGEWFYNPVQGVRSIDEFLSMKLQPGTTRRVGHGLALAADWSQAWARLADEPLIECFDDLVWAFQVLEAHDLRPDSRRWLSRIAHELAPTVFPNLGLEGADNLMQDAWRAYVLRTKTDFLCRVGYLREDSMGRLAFKDGLPSVRGGNVIERMALAGLEAGGASTTPVGDHFRGREPALRELEDVLRNVYRSVADKVVARLQATGAIVETCPTSNVLIAGVTGYEDHPISAFLERDVRVTVNSDDPSIFHAFLRDELAHVEPYIRPYMGEVLRRGVDTVGPRLQPETSGQQARDVIRLLG